jgi:hypothetical protein
MGSIVGNSLDLIRTVFNRNNVLPLPSTYWDAAARGSFFMQGYGLGPVTGGNSQLADSVRLEEDLMTRYADYDEMDQFPELGAAIDLFADDATVQDVLTGKSMWFESDDETVGHILNDMLDVNLKVENELWEIARSLCKYGNEFIEPIVLDQVGVVKLNHVPPPWMRRIEDINGILYGYMQDPAMQFSIDTRTFLERVKNKGATVMELPVNMGQGWLQVYEPWEIVHMRLRSRARRDLYGYSVVEAARYAWKRLSMMEDAMLMYKVTRSPQRYAFYVDVGDVPPNQARGLLNRIKNDFKKSKFIDPTTGKPSFRYSPLSAEDDFFIPVRKERKGTEIEVLAGPEGQSVEDVEYFLNKIFAALKIPKSYLGADETVGRANLSQLDVRMCRSVMRIQREIKNGFRQIGRVDLAAKNIDPDRTSFECHMVIPSGVFELAQIEVEKAKLDLASAYRDASFSQYWIYSKVLGLSDEEILQIQKQRAKEGEGDFTAEDVGLIHDRLPRMVERLSTDYDKRADRHQKKILDEIESGNTALGRRLRELKHLTQEIKSGIARQTRVNGRRK